MRFSMYHAAGHHSVLCFCNAKSQIMFWDMARLTAYHEFMMHVSDPGRDKTQPIKRPAWLATNRKKQPVTEAKRNGDLHLLGLTKTPVGHDPYAVKATLSNQYTAETLDGWALKYDMANPHNVIKAHKVETFSTTGFVGRQVAWSPGGEWCVIVGSRNMAMVLQRWPKTGALNRASNQPTPVPTGSTPAPNEPTPVPSLGADVSNGGDVMDVDAAQTGVPEAIM